MISTPNHTKPAGHGWAKLGIILGGGVSIAANIAHSFIPPAGVPADWSPEPGAVLLSMVWPVFLFIGIEILVKSSWPHMWHWQLLRWSGLLPVVLVSGLVSYRHLHGLLLYYGEESIVAMLGPLAVDGVMAMATGALIAINATTRRTTPAAPTTTVDTPPAVVTVDTPPATKPHKAATPRKTTPAKKTPAKKTTPPRKATTPPVSAPVTNPVGESATPPATPPAPVVPAAPAKASAPSTTDTLVATVQGAPPLKTPAPAAMLTRATHVAEAHRTTTGTPITPGELAVRMRINSDTAEQLLAQLALRPDNPTLPVTTVNGARVPATR